MLVTIFIGSWEWWSCCQNKVEPLKHTVSPGDASYKTTSCCREAFNTNVKWNQVCVHACTCVFVYTLVSVSHQQRWFVNQKKENMRRQGEDWRCRKRTTLLAFLSTSEIFVGLLFLTLSFHSVSMHILCTIGILQYYLAVLVLDEGRRFVSWFMMLLDVGCLSVQAKHFQCSFFIPVSVFPVPFPTDSLS